MLPANLDMLSLDELFAEAKRGMMIAEVAKRPRITNKATAAERGGTAADPAMLYADPANWTRRHGVALVHKTSQSLMGNFWLWTHNSIPGARRLVRSPVPIAVAAIEEADYGYYAEEPMLYHASPRAAQVIAATLSVMLDFPACAATDVALGVHFVDDYTSRVELLAAVTFVEGDLLLELPAGTNILPVMSRASKLEVRKLLPTAADHTLAATPWHFTNTRKESI